MNDSKIGLCVPTLNAGSEWSDWLKQLSCQKACLDISIIIDSSSDDNTVDLAKNAGLRVHSISRSDFNHGSTRQLGVRLMSEVEIIVFLTQDAILFSPGSISNLLLEFENPTVGAAYGRQLPRKKASYIEKHSRLYNYSDKPHINSLADSKTHGIKTAFISNSFSAYRCSALEQVGGFPTNTILGEDTYAAAKMLISGWKIAYCADAKVYHSHDYSYLEEFRRYFDIGVFHSRESWLRDEFGQAEGEGMRYVKSEFRYLLKRNPLMIPFALLRTVMKLVGYKLGLYERYLPLKLKYLLSMHSAYWVNNF